jgi:erythromycin esterase
MTLFLLLLLTVSVDAAGRSRAVRAPSNPDAFITRDPATVAGWLQLHGHPLTTAEFYSAGAFELEPLRGMVGDATVVGLGDTSHGTHEFFTVKHRIIDFLVRELSFDAVVLEAPVPQFFRLNDYVLGGNVDPRAVIREAATAEGVGYFFWETEELLALVEWMRAYNMSRGPRPPVQIFGGDIFAQVHAYSDVLAYLRTVDANLATLAEGEYACIGTNHFTRSCIAEATRVRDAMLAAEADLIARSSSVAFNRALYSAMTVINTHMGNSGRDETMAENVTFIRDRFSATGRVIYWAHTAHVAQTDMTVYRNPAGERLAARYGDDYFVIGTATGSGSLHVWSLAGGQRVRRIDTFDPLDAESHEAMLRQRGTLPFLLPLRGELPGWLTAPRLMNIGSAAEASTSRETLPAIFDAVVYIDRSTPSRMLP